MDFVDRQEAAKTDRRYISGGITYDNRNLINGWKTSASKEPCIL